MRKAMKTIKNIVLTILVLFAIATLVIMAYNAYKNEDRINKLPQEINSYTDMFILGQHNGTYGYQSVLVLTGIGTIILGTIIGLIISLKENSKVKYILYCIFAFILYNGALSILTIFAERNFGLHTTFLDTYLECCIDKRYILYYFIFVIGVVTIILVNNKNKVKELNDELNKKKAKK